MASVAEIKKKLKEKGIVGTVGQADENSEDNKYKVTSRYQEIKNKVKSEGLSFDDYGVDQDYINTFLKDAQNFFDTAATDRESLGWSNAYSTYKIKQDMYSDIYKRSGYVRTWLNANKKNLDTKTYDSLSETLDQINNNGSLIVNHYKNTKDYFSNFESEEAYNEYLYSLKTPEEKYESAQKEYDLIKDDYETIKSIDKQLWDISTKLGTNNLYLYTPELSIEEKDQLTQKENELKNQRQEIYDRYGGKEAAQEYFQPIFDRLRKARGEFNAYKAEIEKHDNLKNEYESAQKEYDTTIGDRNTIESIKAQISKIQRKNPLLSDLNRVISRNPNIQLGENERKLIELNNQLEEIYARYGGEKATEKYFRDTELRFKSSESNWERYKMDYANDPNSEYYDPEFEKYAQMGADIKNPTAIEAERKNGEQVGNLVTYSRENAAMMAMGGVTCSEYTDANILYNFLTDDEVDMYNYRLAKYGKVDGKLYLHSLEETLKYRQAEDIATGLRGKPLLETLFAVGAGLDQFASGVKNIDNYIAGTDPDPVTTTQIASSMIREDMDGFWGVAYDAINTTTNMLPSIGASILANTVVPGSGVVVGTALMASSAGGNAYAEMRNLGYDETRSGIYATLVAASEAALQYALGGISPLGSAKGGAFSRLTDEALGQVNKAFGRFAIQVGANMLDEGFEEMAQSVLEPIFKTMITGEKYDVDWGEVVYSGLLGALSAGMLEGTGTAVGEISTYKTGKAIKSDSNLVDRLTKLGSTMSADSVAYNLAGKVDANTGAYTVGRLLNEVGASLSESNMSDIVKSLERKGVTTKDANTIAKWLNKAVEGEYFNKKQIKALEENELISQTFKDVIINQNSTVWQRINGYTQAQNTVNDMVNAAKESKKATKESTQVAKEVSATKDTSIKESTSETKNKVSQNGKTMLGDTEVSIKEIASIKDGEVMLRLEDDSTVNARDVDYSSDDEGLIYEAVTDMKLNAATANAFVKGYNPSEGISANEYILGFKEAYKYGEYGFPVNEMSQDGFSARLSRFQRDLAYGLGKTDAKYKTEAKQKAVTEKSSETASKKEQGRKGRVHYEGGVLAKSMTSRQKASLKGLETLADALGVDFYVFESEADENGKRKGANGWFDSKDGSIHIDLYAGQNGEGTMLFTAAHELTHFIREWSPTKFKIFADFLLEQYGQKGISIDELVSNQIEKAKRNGRNIDFDTAYEEVIADSCEAMLADGDAIAKIAELKAKDQSLWQKIKDFITDLVAKIKAVYEGLSPDSIEGQYVSEMLDSMEKLKALWTEALVDASDSYNASNLVEVDTNTESIAPTMFSERTWTESEYVIEREKTAEKIAKALGVTKAKALSYIDSINSIAKMIADDRARLDYEASSFGSAFVSNVEYGGSFDYTTLCKKRRIYTGTFTEIQKRLKDVALTPDDILAIRNMMIEEGIEATCGLCYVEGSRANMGKFAKEFIRLYKRDNANAWIPNMADVNTPDGVEQMRINHPEAYDQYVYFWNHYGKLKDSDPALFASQQKPKLYEARKEYKGEILEHFKGDSTVAKKNLNGGIRMQSFSDFEIVHLIDTMQVIMDMSTVGLAGQAYTKVPEFAKAFGNTGLKINLSLIAKGVDADGNLIFDDREGMPHDTAFELRDRYSQNVGTIIVTFTDAQLLAAMADPRIDFIIPFHRSQWKKGQYGAMGLPKGTKDYTFMQNEKLIKQTYHEYRGRMVKDKASNYMPNEYWDFSKSGKENAEAYLKMCAENNKRPKFYKLLDNDGKGTYSLKKDGSTDGYWKLLIDFKMYDNDGVGSPQQAVTPTFNMDEAKTMLDEYQGGHSKYPVASGVVDKFVEQYNKDNKTKYSDRYQAAEENPDILSMTAKVESGDFKANDKVYLGTVSNNIAKQIQKLTGVNVDGFKVAIEARQIDHILKDHGKNGASDKSMANPSDLAKMEYAIENYDDIRAAGKTQAYTHMVNGKNKTADTVLYEKAIGEKAYYVVQAVPDTKAKTLYIVTAFIGKKGYKKEVSQLINANSLDATAKTGSATTSVNSISQDTEIVNRKFSDRNNYAPTFYSHMGKVVDDIKLEKMGSASILNHLKNRGVKAEEIKWSGIETFLEGKKSVTKAELQEFIAGSQLQIVEQMSGEDIDLRYDGSERAYKLYNSEGKVIDTFTYNEFLDGYVAESDEEIYSHGIELEEALREEYGITSAPKWAQYKLDGGTNYREIVFQLPNSTYSNRAMRGHWGQDAEGILVHARIQDFVVDGKKMLFIEELQSDWHNEGREKGYSTPEYEDAVAVYDKLADDYAKKRQAFNKYVRSSEFRSDPDEVSKKKFDWLRSKMDTAEKRMHDAERDIEALKKKGMGDTADAPFRDTYHEYVLKRLLRMAAEEGYDSIGWTPSEIQSERWSEDYEKAYKIEYDQEMPKFLRKYGKQWGATVGKAEITQAEHTVNGEHYDAENIEVWSMDITDSMRNSVLTEGQPLYSDRDPGSVSNRSLLANALESVAQNDIEKTKLAQYKEKIALIESEQAKLTELREKIKELSFARGTRDTKAIKELQFEANQSANRINTYDKQLLNLESTKALKDVLEREKAMARKREQQKGKEALAKQREKAAETQRELMTRYQESRKKNVESRNKTAMRHKIKDVVNELNQYLTKGTKDKHVPIELQKAVAEALDAVNMDTVGAEERIAKKRDEMMRAKTPEAIEKLAKEIRNIEEMGGNMAKKLSRLKTAYDSIINSDDPLIANSHDDVIASSIDKVIEVVGETPLRDMSLYQLEAVYDMYKMVLTSVRNANKAFKAKKSEEISVIANRVMEEIDKIGKKRLYRTKAAQTASTFDWNNLKPVYAFERIGSDTFTEVFNNVRAGEDTWAVDITEAKEFSAEQRKNFKYDSWDFKKRYGFTSSSGMDFDLSLEQIMSLYAYSKREQAKDHLKKGGIVFDETTEVTIKNKIGIPVKFNPTQATAYNLSDETLADIISKLTPEQKAFVDAMQDYLSSTMGEKGNEVSLALYGVKLYKEKNYFPLKSATQFMAKAKEQQKGEIKIKNSGFSKETTPKANNPIVLTPFMDVWANHVNDMSMYHAFVLPLEDFYRVFNYKTPTSDTMATESVEMYLQNAYGKAATQYIDQLLKDLNGGARSDPRESLGKSLMSNFKKASVIGSLSVIIQQPSAIVRAYALIDAKYFVGKPSKGKHKEKWAEVKKYAPVAIIKEMGYFDTGMGKGSVDWLKGEKTVKDKVDDFASKAPAFMDEVTWVTIWNAVKRETLHTHKDLKPNSEEFLKAVGERFTEVIVKTQVYDSTLARSANMRSKGALMNMWTAFMAEPTTAINMIQDAFRKGKRGKNTVRVLGAVYGSVLLNSALVSIVYAMRDDDEDETFLEKYLSRLTTETIDGMNLLTYIPFVKDVWSVLQGFDVERADMSLITKVSDSLQQLVKVVSKDTSDMDEDELADHRKAINGAILSITDNLASLFGVPVKNVRRDLNGIINAYNTIKEDASGRKTTAGSLGDIILEDIKDSIPVWGWFPDESKGDKLYDAIMKGDTAYIDRLKSGYKDEKAYTNAIRKALRENDSRIMEAAMAWYKGDVSEYDRIINEIADEGNFDIDDIKSAIKSGYNILEPDDPTDPSDKNVSMYDVEHYYMAVMDGDVTLANKIREDIINTDVSNGEDREDAEKSFDSRVRTQIRGEYADGTLTRNDAMRMLEKYGGLDSDEAYWKMKEFDYYAENDTTEGYAKYNDFYEAVKTGRNLKAVISEYTSHGVKASTLASQITSYYKPLYIQMSNSERANIKGYLLNAYVLLGYDRTEKSKDINKWLEK